jgi:hypothetical protein
VVEAGGRLLTGRAAATQASIRYMAECWNRLRTWLARYFGVRSTSVQYFRGVELHRSGLAHLHLMIRVPSLTDWFMAYGEFQRAAVQAGFGVKVDIQAVKSRVDAARYSAKAVASYTAKGEAMSLPKYTRRGAVSREWSDWTRPTPLAGFSWSVASCGRATAERALVASGFALVDPASIRVGVPATAGGQRWQ